MRPTIPAIFFPRTIFYRRSLLLFAALFFAGCSTDKQVAPNPVANAGDTNEIWSPQPKNYPDEPIKAHWTNEGKLTASETAKWNGVRVPAKLLRFTFCEDAVIAALADGSFVVLDKAAAEARQTWRGVMDSAPIEMHVASDSQRIVLRYENSRSCEVRDLLNGNLLRTIGPIPADITASVVGMDPRLLALGDANGTVRLFDIDDGQSVGEDQGPDDCGAVDALAFSRDCRRITVSRPKLHRLSSHVLPTLTEDGVDAESWLKVTRLMETASGDALVGISDEGIAHLFDTRVRDNDPTARLLRRFSSSPLPTDSIAEITLLLPSLGLARYRGGQKIDYFDLESSQTFSIVAEEPANATAAVLTRRGEAGAWADSLGGVSIVQFSGPGKFDRSLPYEWSQGLLGKLKSHDFDTLDPRATELFGKVKPTQLGHSAACNLLETLSSPVTQDSSAWQDQLTHLQAWVEAKPDSRVAKVILGNAVKEYGWYLRGCQYSDKTGEQAMRNFGEQLVKAETLLQEADQMGPPSAPLSNILGVVAMGLGKTKDELIDIWKRGVEDEPLYYPLHADIAYALLPRWCGEFGDTGSFAERAWSSLPPESAGLAYVAMARRVLERESPSNLLASGFDLDHLEQAVRNALQVTPHDRRVQELGAIVACMRVDAPVARERLHLVARRNDLRLWYGDTNLQKFTQWSQCRAVVAPEATTFSAAFNHLSGLCFSSDAKHLLTVSSDEWRQICQWDLTTPKSSIARAMPPTVQPWLLSKQGHYLICLDTATNTRVLIVDMRTGKPLPLPETKIKNYALVALADNETQVGFGPEAGVIDVYDLSAAEAKPTLKVKVGDNIKAWDFVVGGTEWGIAGLTSEGTVRHISATGADVVPPIKLPCPGNVVTMIGTNPQIAVGANGLLAVIDLRNQKVTTLVDRPDRDTSEHYYFRFASAGNGNWLAAARYNSQLHDTDNLADIELWDLSSNTKVHTYPGHEGTIWYLRFSPDGSKLASGDEYGVVRVWDTSPFIKGEVDIPKDSGEKSAAAEN
jgi:WD40 repeat protein